MSSEEANSRSPAEEAYDDAMRFAREGAYDKALERHIWFHEHALEHQPSYYGVRLSFALRAWMKLGEKYPPALAALKAVRDRDSARLYDGDPSDHLFHDFVALNRSMGDDIATFTMFRHFEESDSTVAARRFRFLDDEAFESAPELFTKYVDDLEAYFQAICERHVSMNRSFQQAMSRYRESYPDYVAARRTQFGRFDQKFQDAATKLGEMAVARGQHEVAARISVRAEAIQREVQTIQA
jgi:hypothetical protein